MTAPLSSESHGATLPPADTAPGTYAIKVRWKESHPGSPSPPPPRYEDDLSEAKRIACRLTRWQLKEADVVRVADGRLMGWADSGGWVEAHQVAAAVGGAA